MNLSRPDTINRRNMLLALATASTVAATGPADTAPAENPKLIALAEQLPAIAAAYHEAKRDSDAVTEKWDHATPWAPDGLTEIGTAWPHDDIHQPGSPEMKILGGFLWRAGDRFPRRIVLEAWQVSAKIDVARRKKRLAKRKGNIADFAAAEDDITWLKSLEKAARDYERCFGERKREALAECEPLWEVKHAKHEEMEKHVAAIMDQPDHTMEGLIIKAQALAEWNRVGTGHFDRVAFRHGQDWHGQIAASILRHAKGGAQ